VFRVLLISEDGRGVAEALRALPRGAAAVQLRAPGLEAGALLVRARALRPVCAELGAPLLINDRADVALACGADGVHLPGRGLAAADVRALFARRDRPVWIGRSCHSEAEVAQAAREGADYALFSPVWEVPGKGPSQGLAALSRAARAAKLPVLALGGVTPENAASALRAGASGVACLRAVLRASDPAAAARALWQAVSA